MTTSYTITKTLGDGEPLFKTTQKTLNTNANEALKYILPNFKGKLIFPDLRIKSPWTMQKFPDGTIFLRFSIDLDLGDNRRFVHELWKNNWNLANGN